MKTLVLLLVAALAGGAFVACGQSAPTPVVVGPPPGEVAALSAEVAALRDELLIASGTIEALESKPVCLNPTNPCPDCKCDPNDDAKCAEGQCNVAAKPAAQPVAASGHWVLQTVNSGLFGRRRSQQWVWVSGQQQGQQVYRSQCGPGGCR